jgi:hypothetical protein
MVAHTIYKADYRRSWAFPFLHGVSMAFCFQGGDVRNWNVAGKEGLVLDSQDGMKLCSVLALYQLSFVF